MKPGLIIPLLLLFLSLQAAFAQADEFADKRAEADQLYSEQNFKKAYRLYFKLAKTGDHHAQERVSRMYANGEGQSVDIDKAYAWAVVAEEGGVDVMRSSDELLELTDNQRSAKKTALKIQNKYGQQALHEKAIQKAERAAARQSGASMGSNLSR